MMSGMSEEILLRGYPVRLGAEQQEHWDGLLRELQLIALSQPEQREQVPGRLLGLVDLVTKIWSDDQTEPDRLRERALAEGRLTVDLRYPARPEVREVLLALDAVLVEVDAFCRTDDLLALARPAGVLALHQWVVGEFLGQLDGQEPTAWSGPV